MQPGWYADVVSNGIMSACAARKGGTFQWGVRFDFRNWPLPAHSNTCVQVGCQG
jgi:hypothetical protein